jgi:hypothetical protein
LKVNDIKNPNEIIVVRSLTASDLGLFGAHRSALKSKQRALNINAAVAPMLVSPEIYKGKITSKYTCEIFFADYYETSTRSIGKSSKNWRLGGNKIDNQSFSILDSCDFALIRTVEKNDGTYPIKIVFISKTQQSKVHKKIVRLVEPTIRASIALYREDSAGFAELAEFFPLSSARVKKGRR